jgi:hypothetical protein|tara:strand:+ start:771 stop:1187 length:417 start_codon:yes stop_codon:yes gene_type:complete
MVVKNNEESNSGLFSWTTIVIFERDGDTFYHIIQPYLFDTDHIFPYLLYRKAREYEKTGQTKKSLSELNRLKVTPASTNVVRALADVLSPIFDERTSSVWNDRVFGAITSSGVMVAKGSKVCWSNSSHPATSSYVITS